jgi:hypothetical protein
VKKILLVAVLLAAGYFLAAPQSDVSLPANTGQSIQPATTSADELLARAFDQQLSNIQVEGRGIVSKILRDDNDGSRHQRLLVRLASGQTLLIAHNIDLAPRLDGVREGDEVAFHGEYEWNNKGGVIHWTHHDPQGRHAAGWLEHKGRRYQ